MLYTYSLNQVLVLEATSAPHTRLRNREMAELNLDVLDSSLTIHPGLSLQRWTELPQFISLFALVPIDGLSEEYERCRYSHLGLPKRTAINVVSFMVPYSIQTRFQSQEGPERFLQMDEVILKLSMTALDRTALSQYSSSKQSQRRHPPSLLDYQKLPPTATNSETTCQTPTSI